MHDRLQVFVHGVGKQPFLTLTVTQETPQQHLLTILAAKPSIKYNVQVLEPDKGVLIPSPRHLLVPTHAVISVGLGHTTNNLSLYVNMNPDISQVMVGSQRFSYATLFNDTKK